MMANAVELDAGIAHITSKNVIRKRKNH